VTDDAQYRSRLARFFKRLVPFTFACILGFRLFARILGVRLFACILGVRLFACILGVRLRIWNHMYDPVFYWVFILVFILVLFV
jgi:hypothetical protein